MNTPRSEADRIVTRLVLLWSLAITLICAGFLYALTQDLLPDTRFTPIFRHLLATQDSRSIWLMLGVLVVAVLWRRPAPIIQLVDWLALRHKPVIFAVVTLLCAGSLFVYHNYPVSMDEYSGVFQAQIFASGHIVARLPPDLVNWLILPLFNGQFLFASPVTGQAVAFYWPGFALLLTLFEFIGTPWLCNPLLAGLSLWLIFRITAHVSGNSRAGGWALLFAISSAAFAGNAISYYSMQAHMTANLLYVWLLLTPTSRRVLAAGIVGSLALIMHNPFRHAIFAVPWILALLWNPAQRRYLVPLVLGYLPITIVVGLGWALLRTNIVAQSGDTTLLNSTLGAYGVPFSWLDISIIFLRIATYVKMWCWAMPGLLLIAALGAIQHRHNPTVMKMAMSVLLTLFGFAFFVTDQGHGWGNRQFHGAWGVIPILAGCTMVDHQAFRERLISFSGCAAILSALLLVPTQLWQMERFVANHLAQIPAPTLPGGNFYFINTSTGFYTLDMIQNNPTLTRPDIRMPDRGAAANAAVMQRHWPNAVKVAAGNWGEQWHSPSYHAPTNIQNLRPATATSGHQTD